jgi:cysteine desulfurase
VPGIVGFAAALELSIKLMEEENLRYQKWVKIMMDSFQKESNPVALNGHPTERLKHNLNVSFANVENKALIQSVKSKLAISSGSACTTLNVEPSHVILALGLCAERAHTAIRFGLGRFNTLEEIEFAADYITRNVIRLRKLNFS